MNFNKTIAIFGAGDLFNIGGLQRSYSLLTDYLVNKGHEVQFYSLGEKATNREIAFPFNKAVRLEFIKLNPSSLIECFSNNKPDVFLIVNSGQPLLSVLLALKHLNVPVVASIRGSSEYCLKYLWPCMKSMELAFLGAAACHVLMPSYKQMFSTAVQRKIQNIPSQIQSANSLAMPQQSSESGRFYLLYSGRYSFEKRVDLLIDAFNSLNEDFPEWDLWLYGNGPLEEKYREQVESLNLNGRVIFGEATNTDEMYQVYPQVHLKVLPSEQEGCPMALREAMAHAVPVIGYQECSGTNEIIEHNVDGLLVDNDDRVERLAESMRYLMERPELRKEMGLKAKEKAAQYEPDFINAQWEKLLLDAISGEGKASPEIREKYLEKHEEAERILNDLIAKERYRDIYIFDRAPDLFEQHKEEYLIIYGHRLFDKRFYLEEYFEVKKAGVDPLLHYVSEGWQLGYHPSAEFDNQLYQEMFMQGEEKKCPLYHFYTTGRFEGAYPIPPETDYFEKWPGRKPKKPYSIAEDSELELKFLKEMNVEG